MSDQTLRERLQAAIAAEHETLLSGGFTEKGVRLTGRLATSDLLRMLEETAEAPPRADGPAPATIFAIQHYVYPEWRNQHSDEDLFQTRESAEAFVAEEAQRRRHEIITTRVKHSKERHDAWRRRKALKAAGFDEAPGVEPEILTEKTALPESERLTDELIGCRVVEIALAR